MKLESYKNLFKGINKKLNNFNFILFLENIRNFKTEDLKNLNYRRLLYDLRNSKYLKPSLGLSGAFLLTTFFLIPAFETITSTIKKAKEYKDESINLPNKISELKEKSLQFEEIKTKMNDINSSFLNKEQIIFIAQLLNETAKKTDVIINSFSPLIRSDSSKLCKTNTFQKKSQKFKSVKKKSRLKTKGLITDNFFEVTFLSDYLNIIEFLKEIQLYDVVVIPYCLEVNSQQKSTGLISEKIEDQNLLIIPLNKKGKPTISYEEIDNFNLNTDLVNVETRVVFKIPSLNN